MRRKSMTKLGALTLLLSVLLLASLQACANSESMTQPPVKKLVVQMHIEIYAKKEDLQVACKPAPGQVTNGCTYTLGKGRFRMLMVQPKSFCDWDRMRTMGHELMHVLGYNHSEDYLVFASLGTNYAATDCDFQ